MTDHLLCTHRIGATLPASAYTKVQGLDSAPFGKMGRILPLTESLGNRVPCNHSRSDDTLLRIPTPHLSLIKLQWKTYFYFLTLPALLFLISGHPRGSRLSLIHFCLAPLESPPERDKRPKMQKDLRQHCEFGSSQLAWLHC